MSLSELELKLKVLPSSPGVYQFFDSAGKILYVGKAKNLKKRVSSYFNKDHQGKTKVLVSKIKDITTIIVDSEFDALLLENNLIKENQPRYNILLKDDKSYPWICIKNEPFPRVFLTRNVVKDGSEYFGPYASVTIAKTLLELINSLYPIRSCTYNLRKGNIENNKFSVCLEFHMKNCMGPCERLQSKEEYDKIIKQVREIIKGNFKDSLVHFTKDMKKSAETLDFENAQLLKEKIRQLNNYQAKSTIISSTLNNLDIFGAIEDSTHVYLNYMKLIEGRIIQSYTVDVKKKLEETIPNVLVYFMIEVQNRFGELSKNIFTSTEVDIELPNTKLFVPKIGDNKRLIYLSIKNAKEYQLEKLKRIKILDPNRHSYRIMQEMKELLHLSKEPRLIEGFDNSNIQGTNPVSACVVFRNGKPAKSEYRIFNVKSVEGPNDFATMEEVIYRRYKRQIAENEELPNLILIDGGKGQLSSAYKSLQMLGLAGKIPIIGIAKRLEEIYYPNDSIPLYLDKTSETLKVLQHIRDEAHRYGIQKHRNRRSKNTFQSELDNIAGIGPKTIQELLKHFKNVGNIKSATEEELENVIGKYKTKIIYNYFIK